MPVVDLFCGCGGLSKGFELAGFNIAAAFDGWQSAITCYNENFDHDAQNMDLNDVEHAVEVIAALEPTIIIGGPPCQEFSNAGKREEGARADLTFKFAQIVTQVHPQYFVMENVPRAQESEAFAKARVLYKENGYGLTEVVLDASRCGVPQKRNRFFCIGALNAEDDFLLDDIFGEYIHEPISVKKYFESKQIPLDIDAYYRHPTTYQRRAIFGVDEVAPTVRGVNRPKPGTYKHHEIDAVGENELESIRHLTYRERATIQTFPANYVFDGLNLSNGDLEQMIGNAVPVGLAQFVAQRLNDYIGRAGGNMTQREIFSAWLRDEKKYSDRSISDVFSRLNRATKILPLNDRDFDRYYLADLEANKEYQGLSTSVRSQIKKAVNLKIAFAARDSANG